MQDHAQSVVEGKKTALVLRDDSISFSFIANFSNGEKLVEKSVLSIEDIGDELGLQYEIILPMDRNSRHASLFMDLSGKVENLRLLRFRHTNTGLQKRIMQTNSFGSYIILFDPTRVYGIEFADMIHSFTMRRDEVVLFSDLIVIPSVIFKRIGTWRDLRQGEDLDILARIASTTGIIAYNPPGIDISVRSNEPVLLKADSLGRSFKSLYDLIIRQRDQIVGSGYRMNDIMEFYRLGSRKRPFRLLLTVYSYFLSRISTVKPYRGEDNNYSSVMDKLLESLILADFRRYNDFRTAPKIILPGNDVKYLRNSGKVWGRIVEDLHAYVSIPDDSIEA